MDELEIVRKFVNTDKIDIGVLLEKMRTEFNFLFKIENEATKELYSINYRANKSIFGSVTDKNIQKAIVKACAKVLNG